MRKFLILFSLTIIIAGCATTAPGAKVNRDKVNQADVVNLKDGKIALAPAAVLDAAAVVLKDQGFEIEKTAADADVVTTVRKHGVTFYGSVDYAVSCKVSLEAGFSKLTWSTISYVSEFITNTDPVGLELSDKWNIAVYDKFVETGLITKEAQIKATAVPAEKNAASPAATAVPLVKDSDLPPPPKEEE